MITKDELKEFLDITGTDDDSLLESIILSVEKSVENYCDRVFDKTVYTDQILDGPGDTDLFLPQYPIISVDSIYRHYKNFTDEEYDSDFYYVYNDAGYIYRAAGWNNRRQGIKITYTAGYEDIPEDLELALKQICSAVYQRRETQSVEEVRIGKTLIHYADVDYSGITSQILANYINHFMKA